jgi:23S rRNA (guanosine2251-2'-O)-methyltransferase
MGRNCVGEMLAHHPERICEVFLAESKGDQAQGRRGALRDLIDQQRIRFNECSRQELDQMVQSDSHQGIVARVKPRVFLAFEELLELARSNDSLRVLALDGVLDPQNLGAILRAAECFGVDAVIWSKNRAAPLGPVVSKVSVGASELVPLCPVPNLHRAIEALKEVGVWSVGALVSPDATSIEAFDPPQKWVVVMGSEGEGIQHLIEQNLDFRVYIKMFGVISSLNVSQATAVFLQQMTRKC